MVDTTVWVRDVVPFSINIEEGRRDEHRVLRHITGKRARQLGYRAWEMPGLVGVREAAGMQLLMKYIGIHQATVPQWVELRPLFEVCAR